MLRRIANREALACENLSECVRHLIVREGTKHKTGLEYPNCIPSQRQAAPTEGRAVTEDQPGKERPGPHDRHPGRKKEH